MCHRLSRGEVKVKSPITGANLKKAEAYSSALDESLPVFGFTRETTEKAARTAGAAAMLTCCSRANMQTRRH